MKFPSLVQWKQFFKILSRKEKLAFFIFAFLAVASAITLAAALYANHTMTVAADNGSLHRRHCGPTAFFKSGLCRFIQRRPGYRAHCFLPDCWNTAKTAKSSADWPITKFPTTAKPMNSSLKDNLYWSDGAPITSDDAIYTIKTIQDPAYKSPLRPQWIGVETEKISDTGFRLKLKNPYAAFLENCTLKIIPAAYLGKTPIPTVFRFRHSI